MSKFISLEQTIRSLGAKSASQPMEKDMNDQIHVGSYTSKHFEVSRPAQKLFASLPKDIDSDAAEKSANFHDKLFELHKKAMASKKASQADVDTAEDLSKKIMYLAKTMKLEDKHGHVKTTVDYIKSVFAGEQKDTPDADSVAKAFAAQPKEYQSDVKSDSDIDNMAKFRISRDKRAQRKLKIIDDQFIPGVTNMDRIENVSPSFLAAMKQVQANGKELEEKKLIGKQHKLDKNKNGELDAHDFELLRGKKSKMKAEDVSEAKHNNTPEGINCPVCGMKACPPKATNEEVNLDEVMATIDHSWSPRGLTAIRDSLNKNKITHQITTMQHPDGTNLSHITSDHPKFVSHMTKLAKKTDTYDPKIYVHGVNEEVNLNEAGMPSSVIKHKQQLAGMTDKEFTEKHGNKTEKQLRSLAWSHGYGKPGTPGHDHYVNRAAKGKTNEETNIDEASKYYNTPANLKKQLENKYGTAQATKIYADENGGEIHHITRHLNDRGEDRYETRVHKLEGSGSIKNRKIGDLIRHVGNRKRKTNEETELDEAQFLFIKKGMTRRRIRNNPDEIGRARKNGWAINMGDEVEHDGVVLDEADNAMKAIGTQQKKQVIQREVQQKKAMFAKKNNIDKQKFSKSMQNIKAGDEVAADGEQLDEISPGAKSAYLGTAVADLTARSQEHGYNVAKKKKDLGDNPRKIMNRQDGIYRATKGMREEFMERAVAILGEDFADATFEEIVVALQEARGRPRIHPLKDPNAPKAPRGRPKKAAAPVAGAKPAAKKDADREHIVMGLRKAISLRGEHDVMFADGASHQIPMAHAQRALTKHNNLSRPSEKMTFARKLAASKDSFYRALDDKNPGAEPPKKPKITLAKSVG